MRKKDITILPPFFERYVALVDDLTIFQALKDFSPEVLFNSTRLNPLEDHVYATGKWTIRDIVQHCIDTERIMSYRALTFARKDTTYLPGFDENLYARHTTASDRSLESLIFEFSLLRRTNLFLFENFNEEMMLRSGLCNHSEISVLGLGFIIVGHAIHHQQIIEQRYLPLIDP